MLVAALTMICGNIFAQEETTVTWEASSGDALTTIYPDANISLKWEEGGGDFAPKYVSGSVYFYNGNRLTIAGRADDVKIKTIVFTFSSGSASLVTCNASGKNESSNGITNDSEAMTTTWSGEASSLIFRAAKQTKERYISSIAVTYTGGTTGPVETAPVLNLTTTLGDTFDMDAENKVFVVYANNDGDAAAENAKVTVNVDGEENTAWEIGTLAIGEQKWKNMTFDLTTIEAGSHTVTLALTADNADAYTTEKKVTFTKKAPEASYSITANAVTVPYNAENYSVVATLTNTSETVAGADVKVELRKGISDVLATETVASLAAGASEQVTLTVAKDQFETGTKTYYLYVNDKYLASVDVTFEEAPVEDVYDLAVIDITGTIDLANESSQVRVTVQNNGNKDITDAAVTLKAGDTVLGTATVSATAGQQGFCSVTVASASLEAGELAVTATVAVEGDATPADNTLDATLTVKAAPVPTAKFALTAQDVETKVGVETVTVKVNVKNNGDAAGAAEVKLLNGITQLGDTQTTNALEVNAEEELTFTFANPFTAEGEYSLQAMTTDNMYGCYVKVTVAPADVEQVVDIALTEIRGLENINLSAETNAVQVWFDNNSTVDELNATITLTMNSTEVGTEAIAKGDLYKSFTLSTEGLVAGETATLVATLTAENNKEGNTAEVTKTLAIVSGEAEPAAVIALNPVSNLEVEAAGEQTISVSVGVFNNGNADAENVKVKVYQAFGTDLDSKTVSIKQGESTIVSLSFTYDIQKATEFHVAAYLDGVLATETSDFTVSIKEVLADVAVAKIAAIEATTEEDVVIAATLKNNSDIAAENVVVALYQGTEQVEGMQTTVSEIAAGEEAQVQFNLGKLAAGTYNYNVMITSTDANADNNVQDVTVTVAEPVTPVVNVALTAIQGISNIDLAEGVSNTISVWAENTGNVDAEAAIAVTLNGTAVGEAQTVSIKAGKNGSASFTLPTEGLTVGEKATVVATVVVANNTAEEAATTLTREYDIVNSSLATEPAFEVVAENVSVPYNATSFNIVATVKNTSTIDAENVEVKLTKGIEQIGEAQTIASLAGGAETTLTFTVNEVAAGTYYVNVANNKAIAEVVVTVEQEPVTPVVAVALTQVNLAGGQIDLAAKNVATVWVENTGNVDVEATIGLKLNDTELEAQTIIVKAENNGYASFTLPTEGLVAGEKATVVATVTVEGNTAEKVSETKEYDIVDSSVATEPEFSVTAENVTVPFGAASFEITATVKNTSEVVANGLTVKLLKGIDVVEEKTINVTLAAGEETQVTFTIEATEEAPFVAGTTATYYVQAADKTQAEVTVTFAEKAVEEVVDMAVTSISGTLSLDVETNYLTIFVENKGTKDVTNATVTLTAGETELGSATVSAKAGENNTGFCSIAVPATALTAGEFTVVATVTAEGEAETTLADNTLEKTYTIAAPTPELSFTVEASAGTTDATIPVKVTVSNSEKAAAENVVVTVYDASSQKLGEATIAAIAAGASETVTISIENTYTAAGEYKNALQVTVAGVDGVKWAAVTITEGTVGIAAIKAQYGENVQIFTVNGQKVNEVRKGGLYIINGKKTVIK